MRKFFFLLLVCRLATAGVASAQSLGKEMPALAASLTKALVAQGSKNVAAIDFTDLQGQPTELGRFLSEQLSVEMVLAGGVSMLDRANIKSILAEHKLTEEGLVNPANAKKLGEFAGVDAILIGNVTILDGVVLTVKGISTESAKIVTAGRITFPKTADIQQLLNRGVSSIVTASVPTTTATGNGTRYEEANAIAMKDIGSLRVVLRSVLPMKVKDQYDRTVTGIACSFEFASRETQRQLVVALNAESLNRSSPTLTLLRSSVIDDRGGVWKLSSPALGGIGFVQAGVHGRQEAYSASEIVRLLRLRDHLGRDHDDPSDGMSVIGNWSGVGTPPQTFIPFKGNRFIAGSTRTLEPGERVRVNMSFHQEATGTPLPAFFQLSSEIVVGVKTANTSTSYSLQNLTFDRVSMPAR